ncbi:MAG TPA: 30S ribosomal protein S7 [Clostridia bacterium]|jgi:small subunit ribosomal protein S7|nr:30S ribosomal protein S7 [Clostridia bacterium]HHY06808.1 30S ribosomal protein S7 [Clostridia bacterium]
MSRKGNAPIREVSFDPIYDSKLATKIINKIMYDGKRGRAEKIFYNALKIVEEKTGQDGLEVLEQALKNIMPVLEVKARRVGGANYQVPVEVRPERKEALGIRWLAAFARKRGEKTMEQRLAAEILDASKNMGGAVKKREEVHRMAEANKAFAHYRW